MGDIDKAAGRIADAEVFKKMMERGAMPCPYGAGNCLISSPGVKNGEENKGIYQLVACSKARSAQDGMFGTGRREKELREMGCPRPEHGIFTGWKCKYADGSWHPI